MIDKCKMVVVIVLAFAMVAGPAMAQAYSSAGTWTSGGGQITGGGISAGPGGVKTFSLGSNSMYSITPVSPDEAQRLQGQGVQAVAVPADKAIYVTSQTGQPLDIRVGDRSVMPNVIIFGPGGFAGTGVWAGPGTGTGVFVSPGGVSISAVPGAGASVQVGGGAGKGGVSINAGPGMTSTQMYSFTGSAGQTYLVTQQSDGRVDRVLVFFQ